jgi:hypothetical protein
MIEFIQVTAQYSNAVLVAVLPFISDFCQKLELPVATPVTTNAVRVFNCSNRKDHFGGLVVLTNGCQFTFMDGRVCVYRSPMSYYSLQDVDLDPRFFAPIKINEKEALTVAHEAIKKLGDTDEMFHAERPPLITAPEKIKGTAVARYRIRWTDPTRPARGGAGAMPPIALDMEIDASNRRVEMVCLGPTNGVRPDPKVDVVPSLVENPFAKRGLPIGLGEGKKTEPLTVAYRQQFLDTILSDFAVYARRVGVMETLPIISNNIDFAKSAFWSDHGDPQTMLILKNGDRFNYNNGHVAAFYAHDAFETFPFEGNPEDFAGKVNMTAKEAVAMAERAVRNIGYHDKLPKPISDAMRLHGTNQCSRLMVRWAWPGTGFAFASCEIDLENKVIKGLFFDEKPLWRDPPKIDLPMTEQTNSLPEPLQPKPK